MKLTDFKQDASFNRLRMLMGSQEYGHFELFDPQRHLSWQERQFLAGHWLEVPTGVLHAYQDHTLAYKNSHVFSKTEQHFHFSLCDKLKNRISQGRLSAIEVTLSAELLAEKQVCEYCLHAVSYQGFDTYRRRHADYNQQIIKHFSFSQYLHQKYPG